MLKKISFDQFIYVNHKTLILEEDNMLACGEGRRERKRWMEEIHTMSGMNLVELRDAVEDRGLWRRLVTRIHRIDSTR